MSFLFDILLSTHISKENWFWWF